MSCNASCINTCVNRHRAERHPAAGLPDGRTAREGTPMTTMAPPCTAERRGFRARLSTGPAAAAEARRWVRAAIASWQIPVDQDAALLLTSELVTNAVRHEPGQAVMLVISCSRGRL